MQTQEYKIDDIIVTIVKNRCGVLYIKLQEQKDVIVLSTGEARKIIEIIQNEINK